MANLTIQLGQELKQKTIHFAWINWSELSKEGLLKKRIFERFLQTGTLSDKDQEFCDSIDWYPVDELPLKESFVKELKQSRKEPLGKSKTIEEFNKWCDEL